MKDMTMEFSNEYDEFVMSTEISADNVTIDAGHSPPEALSILYNVLVILQVCLLMLAMGTGADVKEIKGHIFKPKGLIVGILCQLVLMPFLTFAFAEALSVHPDLAIGMIVVASCPAGAPANFFTLISRGNISLSVCMTVFSSVLALGMMPLNKMIYIRNWTDKKVIIPYTNIAIGILCTWIPAAIGIFIKYKWPKIGQKLTKIFGVVAFMVLVAFALVQQFVYPGVFQLSWAVWFAAIVIPTFGWVMGFAVATMFMFGISERRAIAYGTSYVNGGLALALITLSFGDTLANEYIMFPMLYTASQLVMASVLGLLHVLYFRLKEEKTLCHRLCTKYKAHRKSKQSLQEAAGHVESPTEVMVAEPADHTHITGTMTANGDLFLRSIEGQQNPPPAYSECAFYYYFYFFIIVSGQHLYKHLNYYNCYFYNAK